MKKEEAKTLLKKIINYTEKVWHKNGWTTHWIVVAGLNLRFLEWTWKEISEDLGKHPSHIRNRVLKALEIASENPDIENYKISELKDIYLKMK